MLSRYHTGQFGASRAPLVTGAGATPAFILIFLPVAPRFHIKFKLFSVLF